EALQRHIAGGDLVPRGRDRDLRLHPVIVAHADGSQHAARGGGFEAVRDIAGPWFDVWRGGVCMDAHAGMLRPIPASACPTLAWWNLIRARSRHRRAGAASSAQSVRNVCP